ncbi:MAG: TIGR00266 family protein, partial [Bdellovibrio sp.]
QESFFINYYANASSNSQHLMLSQSTPGDIVVHELRGESIYIQPGAFIARESGVRARVVWAGLASFFAGEGLFRLCFSGQGRLWYGVYGAVIEKEVVGELLVDSGHLLSYPPEIRLKLGLAGGIFSSVCSGEGLVLRLQGHAKVRLQTRSLKGLAQWLNPRFWG